MAINTRSYYVSTEDGLALLTDVVTMRPVVYDQGPEYQVMYRDSILDEGTFCFDFVHIDASPDIYQEFLNRHIARHGGM